jgi:hypothetical protein
MPSLRKLDSQRLDFGQTFCDLARVTLVLFRRRALGERLGRKSAWARVRKSSQKEAAGAADAGLMQIEWSEEEVFKLAESGAAWRAIERPKSHAIRSIRRRSLIERLVHLSPIPLSPKWL